MYVDKRLAGIQAVQSLSRLNRTHPLKEDAFVLDFVNDREEIHDAFKAYYEGAEMGEAVDPALMYRIKGELDASGIYLSEEVERFCEIYFRPNQRQSAADHQAMNATLDPAVDRFGASFKKGMKTKQSFGAVSFIPSAIYMLSEVRSFRIKIRILKSFTSFCDISRRNFHGAEEDQPTTLTMK